MRNGALGGSGRCWCVNACAGLPLPRWAGRRRRAASRWLYAACKACRWSATESPDQSIQRIKAEPDYAFCRDENSVTVEFQRKFCTSKLKPNVPATTLVKGSCSNSQPKLSNITPNVSLSVGQ